jgi:hypothetical protein
MELVYGARVVVDVSDISPMSAPMSASSFHHQHLTDKTNLYLGMTEQ